MYLYGANRLGSYQADSTPVTGSLTNRYALQRGKRNYELSNHLGNVLVTISDRHIAQEVHIPANGTDYYLADRLSATDYYAFGQPMPGRQYTLAGSSYRFGFNGKEDEREWGNNGIQDYGFRFYSNSLCRFLSVDPLRRKYPELTPFQFASNRPISAIDLDGLEAKDMTRVLSDGEKIVPGINSTTGEVVAATTIVNLMKSQYDLIQKGTGLRWQDIADIDKIVKMVPAIFIADESPGGLDLTSTINEDYAIDDEYLVTISIEVIPTRDSKNKLQKLPGKTKTTTTTSTSSTSEGLVKNDLSGELTVGVKKGPVEGSGTVKKGKSTENKLTTNRGTSRTEEKDALQFKVSYRVTVTTTVTSVGLLGRGTQKSTSDTVEGIGILKRTENPELKP